MSLAAVLPDAPGLLVEQVIIGEEAITLVARLATEAAQCPSCTQPSSCVHSYARRTLLDLPVRGRQMRLSLQVRRFRCLSLTCPRRTFREQVPALAAPHARKTHQMQETLCQIAFALGGEAGARLARVLGLPCSPDTLLRLVQRLPLPASPTPRVLGVDDFSFRRGRLFGTILLDLERRIPIDLLPDRDTPTLAAWLLDHPGIEVVSRDRSRPYREAISQAAPAAIQTADRWHLLKNLGEALEAFLLHKKQALKAALPEVDILPRAPPSPVGGRTKATEEARLSWHNRWVERYHQIHEQVALGVDRETIAAQLGISRKTVYRYLKMDQPPERPSPRDRRALPLERFKPYLLLRWNQGCRNAKLLWREVREQGYAQSRSTVGRFIAALRQETGQPHQFKRVQAASLYSVSALPRQPLTPLQAARLLALPPCQRSPSQEQYLTRLCAADEMLARTYAQVQTFCEMVRQRQGERLDQWLAEVEAQGVQELRSFAKGLQKDYEAVKNGLTLEWSQGPTEGHVHRLKLIKRSMYGRASFPLLRQRVLARP